MGLMPAGSGPISDMLVTASGMVYGLTQGSLFSWSSAQGSIQLLHSFSDAEGALADSLLVGKNGDLLGTLELGGTGVNGGPGRIFDYSVSTQQISFLDPFGGKCGGRDPVALVQDASGNFWGETSQGSFNGSGAIFEFDSTGVIKQVIPFAQSVRTGGFFMDGNGNIFGDYIGLNSVVFEIAAGMPIRTDLLHVAGNVSDLTEDQSGNLLGITDGSVDGEGGVPTLFEIKAGTTDVYQLFSIQSQTLSAFTIDGSANVYLVNTESVNIPTNVAGVSQVIQQATTLTQFSPVSATAAMVAFTSIPSNISAGNNPPSAIQVSVQASNGTTMSFDSSNITLSIESGPDGGELKGTLTQAAFNGTASFPDLLFTKDGDYTLLASDGSLDNAVSEVVHVAYTPPRLVISSIPWSGYLPGDDNVGTVQVSWMNEAGEAITDDSLAENSIVTLSFAGLDAPGVDGTMNSMQMPIQNGVATFSNITLPVGFYQINANDAHNQWLLIHVCRSG